MIEKLLNQRRWQFLITLLLWSFVAIIVSIQLYIQFGDRYIGGWTNIFQRQVVIWYSWLLLTPLIVFLARKVNDAGAGLKIYLAHMVAAIFIHVLHTLIVSVAGSFIFPGGLKMTAILSNIIISSITGNFLIYGFIVILYQSFVFYQEYKSSEAKRNASELKSAQLENQLADARLTALRMQLHPHFLFNTLHSIASLIRLKESKKAIDTLSQLSELLRYTIYENDDNMTELHSEVSFIKRYLNIEELRFSEKLKVKWDIDDTILNYKIPNMLIQPLIENAMKHGLNKSENDSLLIVAIKKAGDKIDFLIEDNGTGLPAGWELKKCSGVGLKNTMERLSSIYGKNFIFSITNITNSSGVRVRLQIPLVADPS